MDPADNLNLVQPVNPWMGSWSMYTEYYQWSDGYNSNSDSYSVNAGQTLHGTLVYIPSKDAYNLTQTVVETGECECSLMGKDLPCARVCVGIHVGSECSLRSCSVCICVCSVIRMHVCMFRMHMCMFAAPSLR